jgi:predicted metal-binding membrane protein
VAKQSLAYDRASLATRAVLVVIAIAAWAMLLLQPASPMPTVGAVDALAFLTAWAVMMAAMMLPSATPKIALYGAGRNRPG